MDYFEILKAKRGLPVSDAYIALLGKKLQGGGYPITEIFGQLPFSFLSRGESISEWTLYGNTVQSGTPTPTTQIEPQGVGERTANLFDPNGVTTNERGETRAGVELPAGTYCITNLSNAACYWRIGVETSTANQINPSAPYVYVNAHDTLVVWVGGNSNKNIMLNAGSTALPYEPYGYKIPIVSGEQTVPVYLGQVQTVRKVKKIVLTGVEEWKQAPDGNFTISLPERATAWSGVLSTNFTANELTYNATLLILRASRTSFETVSDFKAYLSEQYTAGTPVTVWYVLATPTTGIINEPLMKIGDYADELRSTDAGIEIPTVNGENLLTTDTTVIGAARINGRIKETEDSAMNDLLNLMEGM